MKNNLHLFFDYICPYCLKAHNYLKELLPEHPDLNIEWHPCESHPRPERFGPHSDLCIQGYFYALDRGMDVLDYHDRMYQATFKDHVNIENIDALSEYVSDLVDAVSFKQSLQQGTFLEKLAESNKLAFEHSKVWVVPAYRMGTLKLDAAENIGITKEQIRDFLNKFN
ncbi:DsbA family protein [Lacrimispora amygdalina]|uniref:DsbA family protein n=1 Tax=Lacrimispora amygdalina TaxID=253257 RepID=UPI000BE30276|nr:DsbA family protein [Lacrimispora amygdalina]